eukprot:s419_g8.t1
MSNRRVLCDPFAYAGAKELGRRLHGLVWGKTWQVSNTPGRKAAYADVPVTYLQHDVLADDFLPTLQQRIEDVGRPTAILGMHLCGRLSLQAIRTLEIDLVQATRKAVGSKLEFETRALACHGKTVGEAIGKHYRLADLRYDMKAGRVELVKNGETVGPKLKPKADRPVAPKSGQPMPQASLDEFFQFLSCQLQIQSREHFDELPQKDKAAQALFPQVDAGQQWVTGMGAVPHGAGRSRALPYGSGAQQEGLDGEAEVLCHLCLPGSLQTPPPFRRPPGAQSQLRMTKTFWKDPRKAFEAEGPMELAIRAYRAKTKKPLLTNCFRIIPERVLKDDDQNLVRSIVNRSARLMDLAEKSFEVVKKKLSPKQKLSQISDMIQNTEGCGNTWAKMLTVCIDLAYPQEGPPELWWFYL